MNMIMRANATQVSVSTQNMVNKDHNIPIYLFAVSYNSRFVGSRSFNIIGFNSYWMRFGDDRSKYLNK